MSALPKGDTGTTTEDDSGERRRFLLLELVFTLFCSISASDALDSPVAVFESAFLASSNCLLSTHFCAQQTVYYRAPDKQHWLWFDTRCPAGWILADANEWEVFWYAGVSQVPLLCQAPALQQQQWSPRELMGFFSSPPVGNTRPYPFTCGGCWAGFDLHLGAIVASDMDKAATGRQEKPGVSKLYQA